MNLLITGAWKQAADYIEQLKKQHEVLYMKWENDPLPCLYEWVEGIIGNGIFLSHSIEKFKNLKYIQLTSAGYDRIPMDYVQDHHIEVHNAKGVYSIPMAELAIAGVLQLYKQNRFFIKNQEKHTWEKRSDLLELYGKKVCIIGCGDVGTECAKRFRAFGCRVIGVNRTQKKHIEYDEIAKIENLDELLPEMDVIVVAIALTKETYHLLDIERIKKMKDTAILVNLSRGAIVDTEALLARLTNIKGAVLDVFEEEPLSAENALWDMKNVIITPHNSFVGDGNQERLKTIIFRNLES